MSGGTLRDMKSDHPNVSQAVWDSLFPSAKGKAVIDIEHPASTFGVAHSGFCREFRYGSCMAVKSGLAGATCFAIVAAPINVMSHGALNGCCHDGCEGRPQFARRPGH